MSTVILHQRKPGARRLPMTSCPECESDLDIDVEEVEEGDVVACGECGTEYEIVGVEPLELSKVEEGIDDDEDDFKEEDEEEE
jgi:alpha-aminoadipate/glutamate carrier protein LysW